jgi:hypothetical protein
MSTKKKAPAKQKSKVPTDLAVGENRDRKWRINIGPMETVVVAQNAPLCQLVVQNLGPANFEVRCGEMEEPVVLRPGKLTILLAYGTITIESVEEKSAIAEMEFMPRTKY